MDTERQTLSIMKACEVVGVSRRTIYNWMAGGKVQYVRTAGGSVRIFADSLVEEAPGNRQTARFSTDARIAVVGLSSKRAELIWIAGRTRLQICSNGALWNSRGNFASSFTS